RPRARPSSGGSHARRVQEGFAAVRGGRRAARRGAPRARAHSHLGLAAAVRRRQRHAESIQERETMIALLLIALLPDPETAARQHFEKAERAYRVGNYDVAVDEYQAAYDAKPAPELLYDLAQALRKRFAVAGATGDLRRGIEVFRAYLREDPQTPKRE